MTIFEILTLIIGGGLGIGIIKLIFTLGKFHERFVVLDKKFETMDKKFETMDKKFDIVFNEIKELRKDIQSLDSRISRIEGHLTGMNYHWEPRIVEKKEEQK